MIFQMLIFEGWFWGLIFQRLIFPGKRIIRIAEPLILRDGRLFFVEGKRGMGADGG